MSVINQFQSEVRSMILGIPEKYTEYIERMTTELSKLFEKFRKNYNIAMRSKYYLKLSHIQTQSLK